MWGSLCVQRVSGLWPVFVLRRSPSLCQRKLNPLSFYLEKPLEEEGRLYLCVTWGFPLLKHSHCLGFWKGEKPQLQTNCVGVEAGGQCWASWSLSALSIYLILGSLPKPGGHWFSSAAWSPLVSASPAPCARVTYDTALTWSWGICSEVRMLLWVVL